MKFITRTERAIAKISFNLFESEFMFQWVNRTFLFLLQKFPLKTWIDDVLNVEYESNRTIVNYHLIVFARIIGSCIVLSNSSIYISFEITRYVKHVFSWIIIVCPFPRNTLIELHSKSRTKTHIFIATTQKRETTTKNAIMKEYKENAHELNFLCIQSRLCWHREKRIKKTTTTFLYTDTRLF